MGGNGGVPGDVPRLGPDGGTGPLGNIPKLILSNLGPKFTLSALSLDVRVGGNGGVPRDVSRLGPDGGTGTPLGNIPKLILSNLGPMFTLSALRMGWNIGGNGGVEGDGGELWDILRLSLDVRVGPLFSFSTSTKLDEAFVKSLWLL